MIPNDINKIRIGIDFDSTIAQTDEAWLGRFNAAKGTRHQLSDWNDWDVSFIKQEDRPFFFSLLTPDLYDSVSAHEYAADVIHSWARIKELSLVCVTTNPTARSDEFLAAKRRWLQRNIPVLAENIIGVQVKTGQGLAILIDDAPHNHVNGDYISILVKRPWNSAVTCEHSFMDWRDANTTLQKALRQFRELRQT